jgi:hypothetical protein
MLKWLNNFFVEINHKVLKDEFFQVRFYFYLFSTKDISIFSGKPYNLLPEPI